MKHLLFAGFCAVLFAATSFAQISAANWARENKTVLAPLSQGKQLEVILKKGTAGFNEIASKIVTAGKDDPVAATTIAQLTQYVMQHPEFRPAYTANLLVAAKKAKEPDMICFWLCQLRWCGMPGQIGAIGAFEKSQYKCVRDLAKMTIQSIKGQYDPQLKWCKESRARVFSREIAKLPPETRYSRYVKLFEDQDSACRQIALRGGEKGGGAPVTRQWMELYQKQSCPVRKTMILDMFGKRGDRLVVPLLVSALSDPSEEVVAAASAALFKIDHNALIDALPDWLARVEKKNSSVLKNRLDLLTTREIAPKLIKNYSKFSVDGKRLVLDFLHKRMAKEALPLGLEAIDEKDANLAIAGWRLLREIAGKDQANLLIQKAFLAKGRVAPEAHTAIAVASRRGDGAYQAALMKVIATGSEDRKVQALELSPRLGGTELLKQVEVGLISDNSQIQGACARALSDWEGNETIPLLMRAAIAGKSKRVQVLTLRGALKKLTPKVAPLYLEEWKTLKSLPGNDENRKQLADAFKVGKNVALGKPVKTNVATENPHVPANLTDGTLEKAWYGGSSPAAAVIDLGKVVLVNQLHVTFYYSDSRTYTYNLELSVDGKNWKKVVGNEKDPKPATAEGETIRFPQTKARFARLNVLKNSANPSVHVLELELFTSL